MSYGGLSLHRQREFSCVFAVKSRKTTVFIVKPVLFCSFFKGAFCAAINQHYFFILLNMAKKKNTTTIKEIDEQLRLLRKSKTNSARKTKKAAGEKNQAKKDAGSPLRIIPLGGVDGIGKNMTVFEYDDDIIIIDCGLAFPEDSMPGVDLVIPDTTYLEENAGKIRGLFLTHGHEDHIGAVPYLLKKLNVPVYGTRLTLGILEGKLSEHDLLSTAQLIEKKAGDVVKAGIFSVEFIRVTHSIPDSCAFCIETPAGRVIVTGDFKIDLTPARGESINLGRLAELGNSGVRLLMCDSTNVERPGYTPSERVIYPSFDRFFAVKDKRIVIATFSSNVHRIQQIINASAKHGRKVAVTGRSMLNILSAAVRLGYIDIPEGILIDMNEMKRYSPGELTLITTGSQGEPMSALHRMAFGEHAQVTVGHEDIVVLSSSPIPGNEKMISCIVNELLKRGTEVINDSTAEVHVSGHACMEELKIMHALTRPQCFVPLHGEYRHLKKHADLAKQMGMEPRKIIIPQTGKVIELTKRTIKARGEVPSGAIMVDGYSVGDVGVTILRDRRHLAEDGILIVVTAIDRYTGNIVTGPDISTKGFVYAKESEALLDELAKLAQRSIERCLHRGVSDFETMQTRVRDELNSVIYQRTKRRPMIVPIFMDFSL